MQLEWGNPEQTVLLVHDGGVTRVIEPGHPQWASLSAAPDIAPAAPPPAPAPEEIVATFEAAIRARIRAVAAQRQYDSPESAASYVASTEPLWAAEGAAFVAWRDAVWLKANADLAAVLGGAMPQPDSPDAYVATLPAIAWPDPEDFE